MLGAENYQKYVERQNIEVAPLAYMRGRTLDDSFIAHPAGDQAAAIVLLHFLQMSDSSYIPLAYASFKNAM